MSPATSIAATATKIIEVTVQKVYTEANHNCYLFRVPADTDANEFRKAISDSADELWESQFDPGETVCGGTYLAEYESETHTYEQEGAWVCGVDNPDTVPAAVHVFLLKELAEQLNSGDLEDDEAEVQRLKEFRAAVKQLASEIDSRCGTPRHQKGFKEYVLLEAFTRRTGYKDCVDHPVRVIIDGFKSEFDQVKQIFEIEDFSTATVKKPGATF